MLLEVYLQEMQCLQAEENLNLSQVVAVGTASMKKQTLQSILRGWRSTARRSPTRKRPSVPFKQKLVMMASIGIGVVEEPKNA